VLGIEPRALHTLGKHFATELHPHPSPSVYPIVNPSMV
jgi:hypothetical protein